MNKRKLFLGSFIILALTFFMLVPMSQAQLNWWPLPPYNTLWPLWSPTLSPVNALGVSVPIVNNLKPDTVLPVQPGLTWDPDLPYPWLLYNTPLGLAYYDPFFGMDLWPPGYLNILGSPFPITLPKGFSTLLPTSTAWLSAVVPVANNTYYTNYPEFAPLASPASILGIPALIPSLIP